MWLLLLLLHLFLEILDHIDNNNMAVFFGGGGAGQVDPTFSSVLKFAHDYYTNNQLPNSSFSLLDSILPQTEGEDGKGGNLFHPVELIVTEKEVKESGQTLMGFLNAYVKLDGDISSSSSSSSSSFSSSLLYRTRDDMETKKKLKREKKKALQSLPSVITITDISENGLSIDRISNQYKQKNQYTNDMIIRDFDSDDPIEQQIALVKNTIAHYTSLRESEKRIYNNKQSRNVRPFQFRRTQKALELAQSEQLKQEQKNMPSQLLSPISLFSLELATVDITENEIESVKGMIPYTTRTIRNEQGLRLYETTSRYITTPLANLIQLYDGTNAKKCEMAIKNVFQESIDNSKLWIDILLGDFYHELNALDALDIYTDLLDDYLRMFTDLGYWQDAIGIKSSQITDITMSNFLSDLKFSTKLDDETYADYLSGITYELYIGFSTLLIADESMIDYSKIVKTVGPSSGGAERNIWHVHVELQMRMIQLIRRFRIDDITERIFQVDEKPEHTSVLILAMKEYRLAVDALVQPIQPDVFERIMNITKESWDQINYIRLEEAESRDVLLSLVDTYTKLVMTLIINIDALQDDTNLGPSSTKWSILFACHYYIDALLINIPDDRTRTFSYNRYVISPHKKDELENGLTLLNIVAPNPNSYVSQQMFLSQIVRMIRSDEHFFNRFMTLYTSDLAFFENNNSGDPYRPSDKVVYLTSMLSYPSLQNPTTYVGMIYENTIRFILTRTLQDDKEDIEQLDMYLLKVRELEAQDRSMETQQLIKNCIKALTSILTHFQPDNPNVLKIIRLFRAQYKNMEKVMNNIDVIGKALLSVASGLEEKNLPILNQFKIPGGIYKDDKLYVSTENWLKKKGVNILSRVELKRFEVIVKLQDLLANMVNDGQEFAKGILIPVFAMIVMSIASMISSTKFSFLGTSIQMGPLPPMVTVGGIVFAQLGVYIISSHWLLSWIVKFSKSYQSGMLVGNIIVFILLYVNGYLSKQEVKAFISKVEPVVAALPVVVKKEVEETVELLKKSTINNKTKEEETKEEDEPPLLEKVEELKETMTTIKEETKTAGTWCTNLLSILHTAPIPDKQESIAQIKKLTRGVSALAQFVHSIKSSRKVINQFKKRTRIKKGSIHKRKRFKLWLLLSSL